MPLYRIVSYGECREVYEFEAENEDAARDRWESGLEQPVVSEVEGADLSSIEAIDAG